MQSSMSFRSPSLWTSFLLITLALFVNKDCNGSKEIEKVNIGENSLENLIASLCREVCRTQVLKNQSYGVRQWEKLQGIFPSDVKMNFNGKPDLTLLRDVFAIFDNNMFVTNWIAEILLETYHLGTIPELQEETLLNALQPILASKDRNFQRGNLTNYPIYIFWKQIEINGTWVAWPENLKHVMQSTEEFSKFLYEILESLGLDELWEKIAPEIEEMLNMMSAFQVPSDFDDSSCSLALGSWLSTLSISFPNAFRLWEQENSDIAFYTEKIGKYAYKPYSSDSNENSIDPRTFFFLRDFLYETFPLGTETDEQSLSLITTWIMNIDEDRTGYEKQIAMPFNVNNVDLSVCANTIYGISRLYLSRCNNSGYNNNNIKSEDRSKDSCSWFENDKLLQQTLLDSSRLLSWALDSGRITERPDLALLYYPAIYDFYWFVSRTVSLVNNYNSSSALHPVLDTVGRLLTLAMRKSGTKQLLSLGGKEGDLAFWDDFLGEGDLDWFGQPDPHHDDRLFSTAVAMNALIDTWTQSNQHCQLSWISETPKEVVEAVNGGSRFLQRYISGDEYVLSNAFFSGSVKGMAQLPFSYPSNRLEYLNHTLLPPNPDIEFVSNELIDAVESVIAKSDYEFQLNQTHFGMRTSLQFPGYNGQGVFPYWSSEPLTQAVGMLSLSKCQRINECAQKKQLIS